MTDQKIIPLGESDAEDSPGLARRTAGHLRTGLTGHAAVALRTGSLVLLRRGWAYATPRTTIGERLAYGAGGGYALTYVVSQADLGPAGSFLVTGGALAWCVAAWIVAPPPGQQVIVDEPEQPAADEVPVDRELAFVADLIRATAAVHGHKGAHLADIIARGGLRPWEQSDLKHALVHDWGVPVDEIKLRFHGRQRVRDGVRLRDLPPPVEPPPAEPLPGAPATAPAAAPVEAAENPSPHLLPDPTPGAE